MLMSPDAATSEPSDQELSARIARCADSPEAQRALGHLYRRHGRPLLAFLASQVPRSDLEDIHHEVWLRVCKALGQMSEVREFRSWLFKIGQNLVIDYFRRKKIKLLNVDQVDSLVAPPEIAPADGDEEIARLHHCIDSLPSEHQAVVRARLKGESYEELSASLNIPVKTAYKLFHEAKNQLTDCVQRGET